MNFVDDCSFKLVHPYNICKFDTDSLIPYGGKLWRVQTLAEWQGKHHWQNKLWRIDDKSLIKRILKQFEYKSTHNWSIRVHVFANAD